VRERCYSPQLSRLVVCALYHEAKSRGKPMTRLADELLTGALNDTAGMKVAKQILSRALETEVVADTPVRD
jgi:hypothetical protein